MPKIKRDEYYVVDPLPDGFARMTKFVDDEPQHESSYTVGATSCQCFQAGRGQCRHMKMFLFWRKNASRAKMTFVVNKDKTETISFELLAEEGLFASEE